LQRVHVSHTARFPPARPCRCQCAEGYWQTSDGVCRKFWSGPRVAGLVLGAAVLSVLSTIATTMYCLRSTRRRRRLALDLDLHRSLLEETTNEVVALKRAWEIDWRDLTLTTRIDEGAEGAFGEVGPLSDVH